jgi:hypothetical protein
MVAQKQINNSLNEIILRRCSFLANEAKYQPKRDQAITYTMRTISNYISFGRDVSSITAKKENLRVSETAFSKIKDLDIKTWAKETINEHPLPLKVSWEWLKKNSSTITAQNVFDHFLKNPMVTITKEEDQNILKLGIRSSGDPEKRYALAGIKIIELRKKPIDYF